MGTRIELGCLEGKPWHTYSSFNSLKPKGTWIFWIGPKVWQQTTSHSIWLFFFFFFGQANLHIQINHITFPYILSQDRENRGVYENTSDNCNTSFIHLTWVWKSAWFQVSNSEWSDLRFKLISAKRRRKFCYF